MRVYLSGLAAPHRYYFLVSLPPRWKNSGKSYKYPSDGRNFSSSCEFPYLMLLLFREFAIYDVTGKDCSDRGR